MKLVMNSYVSSWQAAHAADLSHPHYHTSYSVGQALKSLGQKILAAMTTPTEPHIWSTTDRQGRVFWNAYDPVNHRYIYNTTETDLMTWLEERYYA